MIVKRDSLRGQWFQDWTDTYGHRFPPSPFVSWHEYLALREREERERAAAAEASDVSSETATQR